MEIYLFWLCKRLHCGQKNIIMASRSVTMYNNLIEKEYIATNGIGGFTSSSLTGANTRKYHGILNASLNSPVSRHILLSKINTDILLDGQSYRLESCETPDTIQDNTSTFVNFEYMPIPCFTYQVADTRIKKELCMVYGENTTAVQYTIKTGNSPIVLRSTLLVNSRDHHDLSEVHGFEYEIKSNQHTLQLKNELTSFSIHGFGDYHTLNEWTDAEFYRIEKRRGQEDTDHNFNIGYFEVTVPANTTQSLGIVTSTEEHVGDSQKIIHSEIERRKALTGDEDVVSQKLHIACDQFIVHRKSTNSKTVIAGYPWFTDWGRDTMIALPGLTLSTKRYDDAKDIIETFIKYEKDGLIPNMFPDDNVEPMYNTIDGTLWLFVAVYQYYQATNDTVFIKDIFTTLQKIITKHIEGTVYDIFVDKDGLLSGGDPSTQLTWMDVKIDGHVVTPRHGKAVEINALWYNALKIMDELSKVLNITSTTNYSLFAEKCQNGFVDQFWNEKDNCLYDLIQDGKAVNRIRPNQVFAISLPFRLLDTDKEKAILSVVEEKLLTPYGLRSLDQNHEDYSPIYNGDVYKRDYAYHQGTVWGWLIGPYLEAHYKVYQDAAYIEDKMKGLIAHLEDTGMGTISEVFSGDAPHHARGCFGQAWSVSELIRIYKMIHQ